MEPAAGGADVLGHVGGEGDEIVVRDALDLVDARDVELAALADVTRGFGGHDASLGHRFRGGGFDEQPRFEPPGFTPDPPHGGMCVACDHARSNRVLSRSRPEVGPSTVAASEPFENRSRATCCTSSAVTFSMLSSVSSSEK